MRKMTIIHKIAYSALFIAIGIILSRVVSLPNLFGLPFLKVSLNPSIVMFSSFYLGPVWGCLVGTCCDVFGALLIPQGGAFNPLFTIPAALTGLMPYLLYKMFNNKFEKKYPISLVIILLLISTFITIYFSLNSSVHTESGKKEYVIEDWLKYTMIFGSFGLSIIYVIGVFLIKNKLRNAKINKYYNIYTIATAIFLTYFVFKIPISSLIKSFVLNWHFWFVYVVQSLVGFVSCFVHVLLVAIIINVTTFMDVKGALVNEECSKNIDKINNSKNDVN